MTPLLEQTSYRVITSEENTIRVSNGEIFWAVAARGSVFEVSFQERADTPRAVMRASAFEDVERYLASQISYDARTRLRCYMISLPWNPGEEAAGFEVRDLRNGWFAVRRTGSEAAGQRDRLELMAEPASAESFVEECRERKHDDLLIQKPGWNRGTPV